MPAAPGKPRRPRLRRAHPRAVAEAFAGDAGGGGVGPGCADGEGRASAAIQRLPGRVSEHRKRCV